MQPHYPPLFERETGCTEAEWQGWLPGAVHGHPLRVDGKGAEVRIGPGRLEVAWTVLPPRRIALMSLPRMAVSYRFSDLDDDARQQFMRRFDLFMLRGGG